MYDILLRISTVNLHKRMLTFQQFTQYNGIVFCIAERYRNITNFAPKDH